MLFCYTYPEAHELEKLNTYLINFLSSIRTASPSSRLNLNKHCGAEFAAIIARSPKLKEKLSKFFSSFKILTQEKKEQFYNLVEKSQKIDEIFQDNSRDISETRTDKLTEIIGNATFNSLVNHLFNITLKSLDIKVCKLPRN